MGLIKSAKDAIGSTLHDQWKDYIKDYDGGTLMEAEIDPKIDYSNLSEILKEQKS